MRAHQHYKPNQALSLVGLVSFGGVDVVARTQQKHEKFRAEPLDAELAALKAQSLALLRRRARMSALASAVPLPGVDALADMALLLELLPNITEQFGLSEAQIQGLDPKVLSAVMKTIRGLGPTLIGKAVSKRLVISLAKGLGLRLTTRQVSKFIPLIGTLGAAVLGYSTFMAVGRRHIEQCIEVRRTVSVLVAAE